VAESSESQQARALHRSIDQAGITVNQLWWHFISIGGSVQQLEIDAYLHHALRLPALERDLLDHAAHEIIHE
jgi:hypothetical protein